MNYKKLNRLLADFDKPLVIKEQLKIGTILMDVAGTFYIVYKVLPNKVYTKMLGVKTNLHFIRSPDVLVEMMRLYRRTVLDICYGYYLRMLNK